MKNLLVKEDHPGPHISYTQQCKILFHMVLHKTIQDEAYIQIQMEGKQWTMLVNSAS